MIFFNSEQNNGANTILLPYHRMSAVLPTVMRGGREWSTSFHSINVTINLLIVCLTTQECQCESVPPSSRECIKKNGNKKTLFGVEQSIFLFVCDHKLINWNAWSLTSNRRFAQSKNLYPIPPFFDVCSLAVVHSTTTFLFNWFSLPLAHLA